jgi:hypothetical protein
MKKHLFGILLAFFEDVFLIYFLGIIAGAGVYFLVSEMGIEGDFFELISSIAIAALGVSIFQRGTLSVLSGKLPRFTVQALVIIVPPLFILSYWPVASLIVGFLGGYAEYQNEKGCKLVIQ